MTRAEIWLPKETPCPVVLVRTPYLRRRAAPNAMVDSRLAGERGYALVLQDVRGRGDSGGTFEPFTTEKRDGFDTVSWIADQPWCDGNVVMAGGSYVGATQWLTAASSPPALRAIAPTLSSDDYGEGWSYTAGVAEHGFMTTWSATAIAPEETRFWDEPEQAWDDVASVAEIAPWLTAWLAEPPDSEYWRERSVASSREDVRVPIMVVAGWFDIFLNASLRSFARSPDQRNRLVIGPWGHEGELSNHVGIANFGIAGAGLDRLFPWILDFHDAAIRGRDASLPPVRAFLLGERAWFDFDSWPPPAASTLRLDLGIEGEIDVNPDDPVPTLGGRGLLVAVPGGGYGVSDQRQLTERADVLTSSPLELDQDLVLAGPIVAHLKTQPVFDDLERTWVATLCVMEPSGTLVNLAEGIARVASAADSVEVHLGDTFAGLADGAQLVLLVAGSSFPRWPRPSARCVQTLLLGSRLELSVLPRTHLPVSSS